MFPPELRPSLSAFFRILLETSTAHFSALRLLFPLMAITENAEREVARKFKQELVSVRTDLLLLRLLHLLRRPVRPHPRPAITVQPLVPREMKMFKFKVSTVRSAPQNVVAMDPVPQMFRLELLESLNACFKIRAETSSVLLHVFLFFLISRMSAVRVPARASRVSFSESVPIPIKPPLVVSSPLPCNLFDSW